MLDPSFQCYHDALMAAISGNAQGMPDLTRVHSVTLVHGEVSVQKLDGTIGRGGHAWVEFVSGKWRFIWDPENKRVFDYDAYIKEVGATELKRFSRQEAIIAALRSGHYGPWTEDEIDRRS